MANITPVGKITFVETATNTYYDIEASHFVDGSLDTPASWKAYIDTQAGAGFTFLVCSKASDTPVGITFTPKGGTTPVTGTLAANSAVKGIYLVYHPHTDATGTIADSYDEYIAAGPEGSKFWEKMGNTDIDLSGYLQKGVTYSAAALNSGVHTHTVSVPTISHTDKKLSATATQGTVTPTTDNVLGEATTFNTTVTPTKKHITASASGTAVGPNGTETVVKSYPGVTKYLSKATITGGKTASKATAENAKEVAKAGTATKYGTANVGSAVTYGTADVGTAVACDDITSWDQGSFTPSVSNGILSFSFVKPTLNYTARSIAPAVASSKTLTPAVAAPDTQTIIPAVANGTITPYTFTDVNDLLTDEGNPISYVDGLSNSGTADAVLTGLGTAQTATALTGVKVTTQPTITLADTATSGGVELVSGIQSASTSAVTSGTGSDIVAAMKSVTVGNPSVTIHAGATGDVDVVESLSTSTTSATTSQHTGHTHDVKVNN